MLPSVKSNGQKPRGLPELGVLFQMSGSQPADLAPQGTFGGTAWKHSSGHTVGGCYCHLVGRVARDAAKHLIRHRTAPHNKELSSLNVNTAKVEKPGCRGREFWPRKFKFQVNFPLSSQRNILTEKTKAN